MNCYVESLKPVWENPSYVFVSEDGLKTCAERMARSDLAIPSWREPVFPEDNRIIEFFGVADAINFHFTTDPKTGQKFDVEYPKGSGQVWTGSMAMAACLKRAMDEGMLIASPLFLMSLTMRDMGYIFRHKTTPMPMLYERHVNLLNLGMTLHGECINFKDIFEMADYRAFNEGTGIVEKIVDLFKCYRDESPWYGCRAQFQKRAQLLALEYYGRAKSSKTLPQLKDPENIGPIADCAVPKTLRAMGILEYAPALAEKVDNGVEIPKDSDMEIEIRAQTIFAVKALIEKINFWRDWYLQKPKVTVAEVDYILWSLGRDPKYSASRRHYTETTAY